MENACTFLLAKRKAWKRVFKTNSELLQNRTEKQIMPFKTKVNWLFTDIWCYLDIGCFHWKIFVSRQRVVRVYYILKGWYILLKPYRLTFQFQKSKLLYIDIKTKLNWAARVKLYSDDGFKKQLLFASS